MKISEMIKNLQEIMSGYGYLDCYYASDDEGNDYYRVYYKPSVYGAVRGKVYSWSDIERMSQRAHEDTVKFEKICVIN